MISEVTSLAILSVVLSLLIAFSAAGATVLIMTRQRKMEKQEGKPPEGDPETGTAQNPIVRLNSGQRVVLEYRLPQHTARYRTIDGKMAMGIARGKDIHPDDRDEFTRYVMVGMLESGYPEGFTWGDSDESS